MKPVNLTVKWKTKNPQILGRDNETFKCFFTLLKMEKPNILLVGEPGVGKTAVVDNIAHLIATRNCPEDLYDYRVMSINTNELIAGPGYRGVTEEKFQKIIDATVGKKVILFFDEFHTVEKLGEMANGSTPGLGNTLKPYLTRSDFKVIGATTVDEYKGITDKALLRRFTKVDIEEPGEEVVKHIITNLSNRYNTTKIRVFNKKDFTQMIYDHSVSSDGNNPDKAKDLTDSIFTYSKLKKVQEISKGYLEDLFEGFLK